MRVKFYTTFRESIGRKEVEVHGVKTVREFIDYLAEHYSPEIKKELLKARALDLTSPLMA